MTENELQELIKLKRYEQPEEGYFENFLTEFQERQRSEILKLSARGLFMERVKTWFDFSSITNKLVLGAGVACTACAVAALTMHFLPKLQQKQQIAMQLDALPTDIAETSSDMLKLSAKESTQVSSEFAHEQLQPIDFTKPETASGPVFSSDQIVF